MEPIYVQHREGQAQWWEEHTEDIEDRKLLFQKTKEGYEPVTEDAGHDAEVAEDRHQDDPAQDPDLQEQHGLTQRRIHLSQQPGSK